MFIPRGSVIHENLATSYVLLDALVEDLCENGFSGIVEILLPASDCHIIIDQGKIAAVIEARDNQPLEHTTVSLMAARSRVERGRISVYSYPAGTAMTLAGRINAEPLYRGLSTEFADVEKMLAKLRREQDRQWFIEINTASEVAALIHLEGEQCRVIIGNGAEEDEASALRRLLDECNRAGARFDVLFKRTAGEDPVDLTAAAGPPQEAAEPAEQEIAIEENIIAAAAEDEDSHDPALLAETDTMTDSSTGQNLELLLPDDLSKSVPADEEGEEEGPCLQPDHSPDERTAPDQHPDTLMKGLGPNTIRLFATGAQLAEPEETESGPEAQASTEAGHAEPLSEGEAMIEIKRLMGEIARTIEEAARTAEPQSKFSMYLRAGQLKIADRFAFLDPFGAEFEYLGGEIAFIGNAAPAEFIEGLTEALKLAVTGVAESSTQPARLRRQVAEDLRRLQSRIGTELERFGLQESIEKIVNV